LAAFEEAALAFAGFAFMRNLVPAPSIS
jgi:hypothetical protein